MIKTNQKEINNSIEIANDDTILSLNFELDQYQQSNLEGLESESSTIQFGNPNHLSLVIPGHYASV